MRRGSYDDAAASIRPHLQNLARRRRSAPSLAFGRVLGKTWNSIREEGLSQVEADQCPFVLGLTNENAELALDESVQLTEGQKTRQRQLFLFSDILVVAKLKASSSYRLKHKVNLEQLWLVTFEDEEGDVGINLKTSLFMAWPLAHCVVSFRSPEVKDRWLHSLHRKIKEAKERSGSRPASQGALMTVLSGTITCKTLPGGGMDSAVKLPSDGDAAPPSKQLRNPDDRACQPIENGSGGKWSLFHKKLRRSSSQPGPAPLLFGRRLSKVCPGGEQLPKPIMEMMTLLLKKGTFTEGVFRKAGNVRSLKEIREQLNAGAEVDMGSKPVNLLAALLKDFLRQLPGSLLVADQYKHWMTALEKEDVQERCAELKQVIDGLPRANVVLLEHLLCVLHHVSQNASANKMDAKNLSICIGPNLLQRDNLALDTNTVGQVTTLTQFLIENCCRILGEHIPTLLGYPDEEEEELVDNSDSLSSQQHDSAYDSTDPDADADAGGAGPRGGQGFEPRSGRRDDRPTPVPSCLARRRSEPAISPSALGLSPGRLGFEEQPLTKQVSDDSFLSPGGRGERGESWAAVTPPNDGSCSSSCSLESSFSNQSESSVFTSSPLASPSGCRRSLLPRHQSLSLPKSRDDLALAPLPPPEKEREAKRRPQSMRADGKDPSQRRARNWSGVRGGSLKKRDAQKEGAAFPCETLREDLPSEAETLDSAPVRFHPRPRPLSAVEVFQRVDSCIPGRPPPYGLALLSGAQPALPQYRTLTVRGARELGIKSRPSSVSEEMLPHAFAAQDPMGCHAQDMPATAQPTLATPVLAVAPSAFRQRAMSETVFRSRQEKMIRRHSQQLFEEILAAKESYI